MDDPFRARGRQGQGSIFSAREQLRRGGKVETAAPFQETEL